MGDTPLTSLAHQVIDALGRGTWGPDALDVLVRAAVAQLPGCTDASLTSVAPGRSPDTVAASSERAVRADGWQYELAQGPCLDAAAGSPLVRASLVDGGTPWPEWASRVASETGYTGVLSVRLGSQARPLGSLNLYGADAPALVALPAEDAESFAALTSVVLASARRAGNLEEAVERRTVIGQAQGILMERYKMTAADAFALLRGLSQQSNTKLFDLAQELAETGQLPPGSGVTPTRPAAGPPTLS
ncbi:MULTISPECIES: ANTAR domain-containing protein [unclassified Modestobacter]